MRLVAHNGNDVLVAFGEALAWVSESDLALARQRRWHYRGAYRKGDKRYLTASHKNTTLYLHREILGAVKGDVVDHINGDTLDNRRANLRFATHSGNVANSSRPKPSSGFRGVHPIHRSSSFSARIRENGIYRYIGCFPTAEAAARAYDEAASRVFGEFATLNFPEAASVQTGGLS